MKRIVCVLIYFSLVTASAQVIKVLDQASKFPVSNVAIFNEDQSKRVVTDKAGRADISEFEAMEIVSFTHVSYVEFEILKKNIIGNTVYLRSTSNQLQEVFLSAARSKEKRERIAEQIDVFSRSEIQKLAPQTTADLLAEMPGVIVQKSQFGGGSPILRGMEANRVLLVVDGVRLNNAIYRHGHLQNSITVAPGMLNRVEVVFGPSSVMYGSDALGGVIHYYTKQPGISDTFNTDVSYMARYNSSNNEITANAGITLSSKKWASYTAVSHSNFGDLKMGKTRNHGFKNWGKVFEYSNNTDDYFEAFPVDNPNPNLQKNTGYNQTDAIQKFYIPLSKKAQLTANLQYSTSSDIPRFDRLIDKKNGNLRFARWYYGPQQRFLAAAQLQLQPAVKWMEKGNITLAFQDVNESRINQKFGSLKKTSRKENVKVYSINADFSVPLTRDKERILAYGVEFAHNDITSTSKGEVLAVNGNRITGVSNYFKVQSRYPDGGGTYSTWAGYINYRQNISSKATLNSGLRYTYTRLTAKWIDTTFFTLPDNDITTGNGALTTTLGYVYKPNKNWQLNGVLSSAFRSPNLDDLGKVREKSGKVTVPNINLKPEYAYNVEMSILKFFNKKKMYFGGTVYYTLLNNYIIREPFSLDGQNTMLYEGEMAKIMANVNKKRAYVWGTTLHLKGELMEHIIARGSLTYTKGKTYDTNKALSSIPPVFGTLSLNYNKSRFDGTLEYRFNSRKKPETYNTEEGTDRYEDTPYIAKTNSFYGTPAWATLNVNTAFRLTKNLKVQAALNNIFNIHYKTYASGISAPGRHISISVTGEF